ncbi:hypothetical protein [uncultured Roseobacter sp.]|uniref:hypothetical protein n=1 Tax=uncultured Roseobacter sp. TaxID=114847 RepID=UPI0026032709|nr:hypothetical protein [uncultured Roseobacter sp.]
MTPGQYEKTRRYGRLFELIRQENQAEVTAGRVVHTEVRAASQADLDRLLRSAQNSLQARA